MIFFYRCCFGVVQLQKFGYFNQKTYFRAYFNNLILKNMKNLFLFFKLAFLAVIDGGIDFISIARVCITHFLTGEHFSPSLGMKVKWGSLMTDGRGKIGGHVASKNRGGAYMRTKVTPVNPQSSDQISVRSAFTAISQAWRTLTADQRASFNGAVANFARTDIFGDLRNPSGANLHQRLNLNLNAVGASYITEAPAVSASPETPVFTITANATTPALSLAWTSGAIPANTAVIVEATPLLSPGKSFVKNQFRQIAVLPAADATPTSVLTEYVAKFGDLVAGQALFMRFKAVSTTSGITGSVTSANVIVA